MTSRGTVCCGRTRHVFVFETEIGVDDEYLAIRADNGSQVIRLNSGFFLLIFGENGDDIRGDALYRLSGAIDIGIAR